jgi:hypothetical protein
MAKYFVGSLFLFLILVSCKKETETFQTASVSDYFPLQVGKYITYDLDSTLFTAFGQTQTVVHYQAQDRVDAQIVDNIGRPSYRIIRFMRKNDTQPWVAHNTFMVTVTENSVEYNENNLRFIKLRLPVVQDFSWKGNSFINTTSNDPDLQYLSDWDYIYDSVGMPLTINSLTIDSTVKVFERDEFLGNDPSNASTQYAEKTYSVEKYGKGIGLIYREFMRWEYQGPQPPFPDDPVVPGYYVGYGVKMSIIDHN